MAGRAAGYRFHQPEKDATLRKHSSAKNKLCREAVHAAPVQKGVITFLKKAVDCGI